MAQMARPHVSQPFPILAPSQSCHLSCHLIHGSEGYLDSESLQKQDMSLVEDGSIELRAISSKIDSHDSQQVALSASVKFLPSQRDSDNTESSLWLKKQWGMADLSTAAVGSQRQWVISEMCWESNSQIAILHSSVVLHESKWNKNILNLKNKQTNKQKKQEREREFASSILSLRQLILKDVF